MTFDAGRRWQSMQLNLPITPIADMRVHRNDLIVATQGRSIWILDDLTPLHQLADVASGARAHLYKPRDAYRVQIGGGDAAGGIEAVPDPAPAGAIIQYYLWAPDRRCGSRFWTAADDGAELLYRHGRSTAKWRADAVEQARQAIALYGT